MPNYDSEQVLEKGTKVTSISGKEYTIERQLGGGGEALVYKVMGPEGEKAMKVYKLNRFHNWKKQYEHLLDLMNLPLIDEAFVMPQDIIYENGEVKLGFIMEFVEGYYKIHDIMDGRVEMSFEGIARAAYKLSKAIAKLHKRGYVYLDINHGNVLISQEGDVKLVDCDNISINGEGTGIKGTMYYIAPEILRGNKMSPSRMQENFSLACFLFQLFCSAHPYMGALEEKESLLDKERELELLTNPVYMFDEQDISNRPVAGVHDAAILYYSMLSQKVKDMFYRSLCTGIEHPFKRVSAAAYMRVFQEMYLNTFSCPACGAQSYYQEEAEQQHCWNCQRELEVGKRMVFKGRSIRLQPDMELPKSLFADFEDDKEVVLKVVEHPTQKGLWGITNCTDKVINLFSKSGNHYIVKPNRSISISEGNQFTVCKEEVKIIS